MLTRILLLLICWALTSVVPAYSERVSLDTDAAPGQTRSINTNFSRVNSMTEELFGKDVELTASIATINTTTDTLFGDINLKAPLLDPVFESAPMAPGYSSSSPDGTRMFNVANSVAFTDTPTEGMCQLSTFLSPPGIYCYLNSQWTLQGVNPTGFTKQTTAPVSTDPPGMYGNTTDGEVYITDSEGFFNISAGTYSVWTAPLEAPTAVISGAGPQIITFTYAEATTAGSTADLCNDYFITMAVAGPLTLAYTSGDTGTAIVCSIVEDIFDTDTLTSAYYTPGTIAAVDDGGLLAAIPNLTSSITNSSTETYTPPSGACGTSSIDATYNFTNLTGLTQDGTWAVASGQVYHTTTSGTSKFLRSTTALDAECQWAKVTIADNIADGNAGLLLRATGLTGLKYVIFMHSNLEESSSIGWLIYNGTTWLSTVQETGSIAYLPVGTVLMAQGRGTGDDTIVDIWVNPTGTMPSDSGSPTYSFTNNPSNPANTGTLAGIYSLDWISPLFRFDDLSVGN